MISRRRHPLEIGTNGNLSGSLLVATPGLADLRFQRSVILVCAHSGEGAMGLVLNKRAQPHISFRDLLSQLRIPFRGAPRSVPVQYGGPLETSRGFVLHTGDYAATANTLHVQSDINVTATLDILKVLAGGGGPREAVLALGYASWGSGQLDEELHQNAWLACEADRDLLFGHDLDEKWRRALGKLGIDLGSFSDKIGRA